MKQLSGILLNKNSSSTILIKSIIVYNIVPVRDLPLPLRFALLHHHATQRRKPLFPDDRLRTGIQPQWLLRGSDGAEEFGFASSQFSSCNTNTRSSVNRVYSPRVDHHEPGRIGGVALGMDIATALAAHVGTGSPGIAFGGAGAHGRAGGIAVAVGGGTGTDSGAGAAAASTLCTTNGATGGAVRDAERLTRESTAISRGI